MSGTDVEKCTAVTELTISARTHFPLGEVYRQEQELAGTEFE